MAEESLSVTDIERSNLPKSAIRKWYERMGGFGGVKRHVSEGAQVIRQGGESGLMGAALGLFEAEHGSLDIKILNHSTPVDGIAAMVGLGASVVMANDATGISTDMRNMGAAALSILSYRKAKEWRERGKGLKSLPKAAHHGELPAEIVDDPILRVAERFTR